MVTNYQLRQATAEVTRLKKRIKEVGNRYYDLEFLEWNLSVAENRVKFIKQELDEKERMALQNWLKR